MDTKRHSTHLGPISRDEFVAMLDPEDEDLLFVFTQTTPARNTADGGPVWERGRYFPTATAVWKYARENLRADQGEISAIRPTEDGGEVVARVEFYDPEHLTLSGL